MQALVMSGGGSRGSWEAGFLKYLGTIKPKGFPFISGTSVGSINAVGLAMFPVERFPDATSYVNKLWTEKVTKTSDIWTLRWPLGIPALWNPSLGTNKAAEKLLTEAVDIEALKASGITLRLPAADLETGKVIEYTTEDLVKHGILPVMASASFPVAFPPVEIGDNWLTDGGVIDMAPIGAAIKAGATKILILATRDPEGVPFKSRKDMGNTIKVADRIIDIMTQTVLEGDLAVCKLVNYLVESGHPLFSGKRQVETAVFGPSKPLGDSLKFEGAVMREQIDLGYEDAKKAHEDGKLDFLLG